MASISSRRPDTFLGFGYACGRGDARGVRLQRKRRKKKKTGSTPLRVHSTKVVLPLFWLSTLCVVLCVIFCACVSQSVHIVRTVVMMLQFAAFPLPPTLFDNDSLNQMHRVPGPIAGRAVCIVVYFQILLLIPTLCLFFSDPCHVRTLRLRRCRTIPLATKKKTSPFMHTLTPPLSYPPSYPTRPLGRRKTQGPLLPIRCSGAV